VCVLHSDHDCERCDLEVERQRGGDSGRIEIFPSLFFSSSLVLVLVSESVQIVGFFCFFPGGDFSPFFFPPPPPPSSREHRACGRKNPPPFFFFFFWWVPRFFFFFFPSRRGALWAPSLSGPTPPGKESFFFPFFFLSFFFSSRTGHLPRGPARAERER